VLALAYHDVVAEHPDESGFPGPGPGLYKLHWSRFRAHVDALDAAVGPPSLDLETGNWVMTFDDTGSCTAQVARELAERGWKAYFFAPTALVGTPGFATVDDLLEAQALGHVVGSHSHTHPARISGLSGEALAEEWGIGVDLLSQLLGRQVTVGCVPGGYTSPRVERAATAAGITTLFTSSPTTRTRTTGTCRVIGRFDIRTETTAESAVGIVRGDGLARAKVVTGHALRSIPRRLLGDSYPPIRRAILARRASATGLGLTVASAMQRLVESGVPAG
jgi:peptidoglycan/xylan/chitin deacetylase (PgdA/CDA1 family)